ncbi:C-type lectin domain family 2 member B [Anas platyrhynchos]|uniref:C-type lectin domain family 2 member B n=1 Tax=Anas platyrhynchos TaxID=8839 RepID=R0KQI8_ANAPL|nr:C-type lectin domain family 2 member B [Anas platyrhynchos]
MPSSSSARPQHTGALPGCRTLLEAADIHPQQSLTLSTQPKPGICTAFEGPQKVLGSKERGRQSEAAGAPRSISPMGLAAPLWDILPCCPSPTAPQPPITPHSPILSPSSPWPARPHVSSTAPGSSPSCLAPAAPTVTRPGEETAPEPACPSEWVGYCNVCYYLSGQQEQGNWIWSQEQCSRHGASLVVVNKDRELKFLRQFKDNGDSWLGLRRRGEHLLWVDGSSFNLTFPVQGSAECICLNGVDMATSSCWQSPPYICSKPLAVGAAPEKGDRERTFSVLGTGGSSH